MARNQEKANLMMNRWTAMKQEMAKPSGSSSNRRPYLASECTNVLEAEKWRRQIVHEISRKVAEIQNAGLGEARIRDLNDEINKLMRIKGHWERQIKALGGVDHHRGGVDVVDADGRTLPGGGGYKYFGAAKDLPGVKELFDAPVPTEPPKQTRAEIASRLRPDYFGFQDEEDGELLAAEAAAEAAALARLPPVNKRARVADDSAAAGAGAEAAAADVEDADEAAPAAAAPRFRAHVEVPSQKDIEQRLLERKRQLLLQKYVLGADGGKGDGSVAAGTAAQKPT